MFAGADLRGNIPSFILISDGKLRDIHVLDHLIYEPGNFYVMDRGFIDFSRLYHLHNAQAFFVIRAKKKLQYRRLYSHEINKETGLRCDQNIVMTGTNTQNSYPVPLRRIKFYDAEQDRLFVFLTNNLDLPAITIIQLYKSRWQVELFFKWIKQHLRINQGLLWHVRKCGAYPDMDCYIRLCIGRNCQKKTTY